MKKIHEEHSNVKPRVMTKLSRLHSGDTFLWSPKPNGEKIELIVIEARAGRSQVKKVTAQNYADAHGLFVLQHVTHDGDVYVEQTGRTVSVSII